MFTICWVKALEKAGVKYSDIESVFLAPRRCARAHSNVGRFRRGSIWDPFQAAAEVATGARTLADGSGYRRQSSVLLWAP